MLLRMRSIIPLLIAALILTMLPLPSASAAAGGPVVQSTYPSDNDTAVPANAKLQLSFDEPVQRGSGTIAIKEVGTNNTVDSLDVATNTSQVQFANANTVLIVPTPGRIQPNVDYYVQISPNAFTGSSAGFVGIADATAWNFHTVAADTTPPQATFNPTNGGTIASTDALTLTFNERVSAAMGNIRIIRRDNQDTQTISVLSSAVSGSGTVDGDGHTVIRIQPPIRLNASTVYDVLIDPGAFVDQVGNPYGGISSTGMWSFQTAAPLIGAPTPSPANNATSVDPSLRTLSLAFGTDMAKGAGKIYLKRVADNATIDTVDVADARVTVAGPSVTIALATALQAGTGYYVQIDPGALKDSAGHLFDGYVDAVSWRFTTTAAADMSQPMVTALSPANNGNTSALDSKLVIQFNKPVLPGSGLIVIRNVSNGTTHCAINVTSAAVVGGGTNTITITPCANFSLNSTYAVQISSQAFVDASGNYFAGISSYDTTTWRFTAAQDTTIPELVSTSPAPQTNSVAQNAVLRMTFNEPVRVVPGLYGQAVLQTASGNGAAVQLALAPDPSDAKTVTLTPVTVDPATGSQSPATYARASQYIVRVPEGAVTDLAGNRYPGIMNAYRWIFNTIGSDTTPPTLKSASMDGSSVLLVFDEDMDDASTPFASNFYVTVNDVPRQVNGVTIQGPQVRLQLQSGVTVGQTVKVSYTLDTRPLQDKSGNKAAAFQSVAVTNTVDTTVPRPTGGSVDGNVLKLTFSKTMAPAAASAASQFTVKLGGSAAGISSFSLSGQTATFVLYGNASNSSPASVSYVPSGSPLYDTSGNAVAAFTDFYVRNANDASAPQLTSASLSGSKLTLVYNEGLDPASVPVKSSFSVLTGSSAATVSAVEISNNTVTITLAQSVAANQNVLVTYIPSTNPIKDLAGNLAPVFSGYQVVAGGGSGTKIASAIASGTSLVLTYSANLSASPVPSVYQYEVRADGSYVGVSSVSVSGAKLTLQLATPVTASQKVTVSYAPVGSPLKDASGLQVDALTAYPVVYSDQAAVAGLPDYLALDGAGGLLYKATAASTALSTTSFGTGANRYVLEQKKMLDAFALWKTGGISGLTQPQVTFEVPAAEAGAIVAFPLQTIMQAQQISADAVVRVSYNGVIFTLPIKAVDYNDMLELSGGNVAGSYLVMRIDRANNMTLSSMLSQKGAQQLATPVTLSAAVLSSGVEKPVAGFDSYVQADVVPTTPASGTTSAVRLDNESGELSYVPSSTGSGASASTVRLMTKNPGTFAVVSKTPSVFSDMRSHWAGSDVAELAAKFIVDGPTASTFNPQQPITRADFAEFIAKGLGLVGDRSYAASRFSDVTTGLGGAAFIGAAANAGIVQGDTTGKFRPNSPITREEMATMMQRAMTVAGTQPTTTGSELNRFADRTKVSSWAKDAMNACVQAGIMNGSTDQKIHPESNTTRAEAAVMVKRLLEYVNML